MRGAVVRRWPSVRARGVVLVAPLRGASARPCPLRRRAARPRASVVLRPLRRPRVPFRGGPGPPRRCPAVVRCALLALGLLRCAPAAVALGLRGLASLLPPSRAWAAALVAAVAARRARSLAPAARRRLWRRRPSPGRGRRGAPPGPLFPRLSALGACAASFPLRVARRLSPLRGFGLGRPRRARAPLRRGPAAGRPRGARRGPLRRAPSWGARAPPAWGWGSAAAAAVPARRCGCSSPAVRRASQRLPRSAYGAMLFKEKVCCKASREAQHVVPVCCSTYKISCEFGKTRIILPNLISKSNIPYGDIILRVKLAKIPVLPNRGDCLLPARFFPAYHAQRETSTKSCRYALA